MNSRSRVLALILALALVAAACGSSTDPGGTAAGDRTDETATTEPEVATATPAPNGAASSGSTGSGVATSSLGFTSRLEPFTACDAFLSYVKTEAGERVGPWGLQTGGYYGGPVAIDEEMAVDDATDASAAETVTDAGNVATPQEAPAATSEGTSSSSDAVGGDDGGTFSGTNVQVTGVDEPDIVKTDGRRIIALRGTTLEVVDVTGAEPVITSSLELSFWGRDILLHGDTVLVMGSDYGYAEPFILEGDAEAGFASDVVDPNYGGGPITTVVQISIAGDATVTNTMRAEGDFISARMIDDIVRLVIASPPPNIGFVFPQGQSTEDIAEEANRRIIEESTLEDWVSNYTITDSTGASTTGPLVECNQLHHPTTFGGFSTLSVLTLNIAEDLNLGGGSGVLAEGRTVYASNDSLYVTTNVWDGDFSTDGILPPDFEDSYSTSVHRFDITDPARATYVASGSVPGTMLNQFSLHEWDNRLFVATTEGSPWGRNQDSESFITVLEPQGQDLVEVGRVGNMGLGEQIFSVRFIESNAYVVTFRQVDPLYVVDLSNPTAPAVTGELKVPGFSTYLHPVGDKLLLGVGQDATDQGRTLGAKLSLFDVADPANPREISTWTMPNSNSAVEWDHRAFLWWEPRQLAVVPMTSWEDQFGGAVAVTISRENGIAEVGRLDNTAPTDGFEILTQCQVYASPWGEELQVCGPDQEPYKDGFYCNIDPYFSENPEFIREVGAEFGIEEDIVVPDGGSVAWCWPEGPTFESIQRSIVIDDDLWTLSDRSLQRNSLDTFEREARIELANFYY